MTGARTLRQLREISQTLYEVHVALQNWWEAAAVQTLIDGVLFSSTRKLFAYFEQSLAWMALKDALVRPIPQVHWTLVCCESCVRDFCATTLQRLHALYMPLIGELYNNGDHLRLKISLLIVLVGPSVRLVSNAKTARDMISCESDLCTLKRVDIGQLAKVKSIKDGRIFLTVHNSTIGDTSLKRVIGYPSKTHLSSLLCQCPLRGIKSGTMLDFQASDNQVLSSDISPTCTNNGVRFPPLLRCPRVFRRCLAYCLHRSLL